MSVQLLDKTRKINKLLHNNHASKVLFNDICEVMVETLDSNILVISRKGKVLGVGTCPGVEEINELIDSEVGGYIDKLLNERLLGVLSTKENVNLETLGFENEMIDHYVAIISPIDIAGERLGTLFMYRSERPYDIEDIIVSEYGTTVVGLEMMRSVHEENAEENRKIQVVKSAFNTLSFSELEAIIHIFDELDGDEGILVASKIADRVGITRSVIVNALRKFESAQNRIRVVRIIVLNFRHQVFNGDFGRLFVNFFHNNIISSLSIACNHIKQFGFSKFCLDVFIVNNRKRLFVHLEDSEFLENFHDKLKCTD